MGLLILCKQYGKSVNATFTLSRFAEKQPCMLKGQAWGPAKVKISIT